MATAAPTPGPTSAPTLRTTPPPRPTPDPGLAEDAPPLALVDAGTEFDSPADLEQWRLSQGEQMDGHQTVAEVVDGKLRVTAAQSAWIETRHGFGLARLIEGDVMVTARIRALGRDADFPDIDWSLAGLMLRSPTLPGGRENWVHVSVGWVARPVVERKSTVGSRSRLSLVDVPRGWTELRLVRAGDGVLVLHRGQGEEWKLDFTYQRPDLPDALEVLLTAQTGGEGDHGDLVAEYDWLRVAESPLDPATVEAVEGGTASMEHVLEQLGD